MAPVLHESLDIEARVAKRLLGLHRRLRSTRAPLSSSSMAAVTTLRTVYPLRHAALASVFQLACPVCRTGPPDGTAAREV